MGKVNLNKKLKRKKRVSTKVHGTSTKPRISVYRSNRYIYAQAIDDEKKSTISAFSSQKLAKAKKADQAKQVGIKLGEMLKAKKITQAVYDRNIYIYKGRIKNLAEGLREAGIKV